MRGKKAVAIFMLVMFVAVIFVGCGSGKDNEGEGGEKKEFAKVGFVTDVNGLGDQAFNDAVHSGVKKATDELDMELTIIESKELADYANSVRTLANEGADIIVLAQNAFVDVANQVAPEYPDVKFLTFDFGIEDMDNVSSVLFREQEAAYLLGALSGLVTEKDQVGYIGGIASPVQDRAMSSFVAGFDTTNKEGKAVNVYTGTYSDVGKGKETALNMYNNGADIVASFAGACNLGAFQAASEKGGDNLAMGAALGQFGINPDKIVASQIKTIDVAVYNSLKDTVEGNFKSGVESWGIEEGGVDLKYNDVNPDLVEKYVTEEDKATVEKLREMVIKGEIDLPLTEEELKGFTSPTMD